jgi:hypothetical protein
MGGTSFENAKLEYALALAGGWTNQNPDRFVGAAFGDFSDPDCPPISASATEKKANSMGTPRIKLVEYLRTKPLRFRIP